VDSLNQPSACQFTCKLIFTVHTAAVAAAGPSTEVAAINKAIGAESAYSLQCKNLVQQYVPDMIKMISQMPLDQVRFSMLFWVQGYALKYILRVAGAAVRAWHE
jgi:hypothetical protein